MKIIVPISNHQEVEMLVQNGADEFFCGFVPEEWLNRYGGLFWLNRRGPVSGNITDYDELEKLCREKDKFNIPVFITFNAPYYTDEQIVFIVKLIKELKETFNIDGVIVSDLGLIEAINSEIKNIRIHASSLMGIKNSYFADYLRAKGVNRVILPRGLTVEQVLTLRKSIVKSEIEVFILNEGCVFDECHCNTSHKTFGAFCNYLRNKTFKLEQRSGVLEGKENFQKKIDKLLSDYMEWVYYVNGCDNTLNEKGIPNGLCGLCYLKIFFDAGIDCVKIPGRSMSSFKKLISLQLVKALLDGIEQNKINESNISSHAKELRGFSEGCRKKIMCYYTYE